LYPGAFAKINLKLFPEKPCILIPARATVPLLDGEQVFVLKNGKAKAVLIKTGYKTGSHVEITEGLAENDTLVTTGLLQIKEGIPVKVRIQNK
jgi:membrane fusion protein (multidrug efflux system)